MHAEKRVIVCGRSWNEKGSVDVLQDEGQHLGKSRVQKGCLVRMAVMAFWQVHAIPQRLQSSLLSHSPSTIVVADYTNAED